MVQIHGPSHRELLRESLGMTLGKGLANFTNSYFAGKALDDVINDKEYKNAVSSERISRLERAMQPFGEYGAETLKNRIGIEQQVQNEQQQKLMQKKAPIVAKALKNQPLTPEEEQMLSPEEHLAIAKHKQQANKPLGGLSGQLVPPEIGQAIPQVLNANSKANADELAVAFDQAGIPRAYSNSYIENRRRQDEAKSGLTGKKMELASKRDEKLFEERDKQRTAIPSLDASLDSMRDAIEGADLGFFSPDNLAEMTGIEYFRTAKGGQFKAASKNFFVNNVQKFGARPNQYIEQQVEKMLPRLGRDRPANLTGLELIQFEHDVRKKNIEVLDEVEDEGFEPGRLGREVDRKMKDYVEQRQLQLANRLKSIDKMSKKPPSQIKKLTPEVALDFLKKANGNRQEAENMALEAGYE